MEKKGLSKEELPPFKRSHSPEEKPESTQSKDSSTESEEVHSANNWERVDLGDEQRKAKFLRLMGAAKKEHKGRFVIGSATAAKPHGRTSEEEKDLEHKLESQFEHNMAEKLQHRNKKHRGLGFDEEESAEKEGEGTSDLGKKESYKT